MKRQPTLNNGEMWHARGGVRTCSKATMRGEHARSADAVCSELFGADVWGLGLSKRNLFFARVWVASHALMSYLPLDGRTDSSTRSSTSRPSRYAPFPCVGVCISCRPTCWPVACFCPKTHTPCSAASGLQTSAEPPHNTPSGYLAAVHVGISVPLAPPTQYTYSLMRHTSGAADDGPAAGHGRHGHGPPGLRSPAADDAAPPAAVPDC